MNLHQRTAAYIATFPQFPASWPWITYSHEQERDVLYAIWEIGNDYRNPTKGFYGSYPRGYLERLMALFPDAVKRQQMGANYVLHAFSGKLPPGPYLRCDIRQQSELLCSVYDLPRLWKGKPKFGLVPADPPYSGPDAKKYGTPMVNRLLAMRALAAVTGRGGHLAWLDTCWPIHSKTQWVTVGQIYVRRSTMHRVRLLSLFERV